MVSDRTAMGFCISMRSVARSGISMLAFGLAGPGALESLSVIDDAQTDVSLLLQCLSHLGSALLTSGCLHLDMSFSMRSATQLGSFLSPFGSRIGFALLCLEHGQMDSLLVLQGTGHFDSPLSICGSASLGLFLVLHALTSTGPVLSAMHACSGAAFLIFDSFKPATSVSLKGFS